MRTAQVVHRSPGRLRLRLARDGGAAAPDLEALAEHLRALLGVIDVRTSELTGSVLIRHRGDPDALCAAAEAQGLLTVTLPPADDTLEPVAQELTRLDDRLLAASNGRFGLRTVAFYAMVAGSIWQLRSGRFLPAGATLLTNAVKMLPDPRR